MSVVATLPFITTAPRDLGGWVSILQQRDLPVPWTTALAIEELCDHEDAVDAHLLAEVMSDDPLMTLKVLRHVAALRARRAGTDAETVTAALLLMGIPPFFRAFQSQPTIEDRLADHPRALEGLTAVLHRAHRAARFALGFAVHRMDHDAEVIHEAALLHDFAEMLVWVHAPSLALQIADLQFADPTLRSADVQRQVLNVTLSDLQQALMRTWHLPELLVNISDDHVSTSPQVRNVQLAIRIARHSTLGWDNPALPDDYTDLSNLLNLAVTHVQQLLTELDA